MELRTFMKNSVEKFKHDNDTFHEQFDSHLAIIRRYDEVLSEKASRHSLYAIETKLNDQYRPVIKDLDDRIDKNLHLIGE